jgi:hypothetical protein
MNTEEHVHVPFVTTIVDPSIRADVERALPSRETRKDNLDNLPVLCDAQCGETIPRSKLKVCSGCKQVC